MKISLIAASIFSFTVLPINTLVAVANPSVIPNGTSVTFSVSEGYPPTFETYCGVVTRWNGASYDIRTSNKQYYLIPERSVVVGC